MIGAPGGSVRRAEQGSDRPRHDIDHRPRQGPLRPRQGPLRVRQFRRCQQHQQSCPESDDGYGMPAH